MRGPATTQCRRLRYSNEGWNSYARLLVEGETRSEEHTSELQSLRHLVCRLLLEKKKKNTDRRALVYLAYLLLMPREYVVSLGNTTSSMCEHRLDDRCAHGTNVCDA